MKVISRNKEKVRISIMGFLILLITFSLLFNNNLFIANQNNFIIENDKSSSLRTSTSEVNGKPLLIHQYSTITNSFFPSSLPTNVSFTLFNGWISQNVNIKYEGVSQKSQRVSNGHFDTSSTGWLYKSNNPTGYDNLGWQSDTGNPEGCTQITIFEGDKSVGDFGYYEQNVSIPEKLSAGLTSRLYIEYYLYSQLQVPNIYVYLAVKIGNVEKNVTYGFQTYLEKNNWLPLSMVYDPSAFGQITPNNATIRVGLYTVVSASVLGSPFIRFDNIKFELWTMPNEPNLVKVFDNEFGSNYTYTNSSFGKGYTFIDIERTREPTNEVIFTIFCNKSDINDFFVYNITIHSSVVRYFNTTFSGVDGSRCTFGDSVSWETYINFSESYKYGEIWAEIIKPTDWNIIHLYDRDNIDRVVSCLGVGLGINKTTIPIGIITASTVERPWKIIATSENYITNANLAYWNGTMFKEGSKFTIGDKFQINVTLNSSITLLNTQLNCTIKFPNGTIYWEESKITSSYNLKFGNFTAGNNMIAGSYQVIVEWTNNQSYLLIEKAGYKTFDFIVWHHTNLTALDSYIEKLAGDPLLIKVKLIDYDLNSTIDFAAVNYSSTFGQSGTMVYIGSGIYFTEIDTSSLELGDYYFSFNASKTYYENQTITSLIRLKIIPQSLSLDLTQHLIETSANKIVSCQVNVTGAITRTLIWPANISTDWFNGYNVTNHDNGTYTLDFSTSDIPTIGYFESYTIEIYANKTGYENAIEFLTLLVHPIPTVASANISLISVYQDDVINIRANYTEFGTNDLIIGANCSVSWQGSYLIIPLSTEFEIILNTTGRTVDFYTVLITFKKSGYGTAFTSIIVIINEKEVDISVTINSIQINENSLIEAYFQQLINISARVSTVIDGIFLSGGMITFISANYQKNLTETPSTYFNTSLVLDGAYFNSGINTIFLRFQQTNYSANIFAFQLYIRAQAINLTVQVDYQYIPENYLLEVFYNQIFHLSCRAYAEIDATFLSGGNISLVNGEKEIELTEYNECWFTSSILITPTFFSIGPNYVFLRFQQHNYTITTYLIQIFVNQIEFSVTTIGFENIIYGNAGDKITIKLNIKEQGNLTYIENATVYYTWNFNVGFFKEIGNGIYELNLLLPTDYSGDYQMQILISKEGNLYRTKEYSLLIGIRPIEVPPILLWVIMISLIVLSGTLGILSFRTYVIKPRKRKKQLELIEKIQVYKDVQNIQAVILIQRNSGIPIYSEETTLFREDEDQGFMISGFIQAIIGFSEAFINKELSEQKAVNSATKGVIELDFKYFQLLVYDYKAIRMLLITKERGSERLKKQLSLLAVALNAQYADKFQQFSGKINEIKSDLQFLINQFLFLHYNDTFQVIKNNDFINSVLASGELTKLEIRLLNVILSITKNEKKFYLRQAIEQISEKNENLILEALDSLIKKKLILSTFIMTNLNLNKGNID